MQNNVTALSSTIIDHEYTVKTDDHVEQIINSMVISIVSRQLVLVREFMEGLKLFGRAV